MSNRDLIITAGNGDYFEDLERFIDSLRGVGEYEGRIVVCDNVITGTWNKPGTYLEKSGFSRGQYEYFKGTGVEVVKLHELIRRSEIQRDEIESIKGRTQRYPYKFVYNCLISREYRRLADRVCYLDSDVVVQQPIRRLFDLVEPGSVFMTPEHDVIGNMETMREWIGTTDVGFGAVKHDFDRVIHGSTNLCTGFIAGDIDSFNRFMQLCWIVAASSRVSFHTDQPLVNVLTHYYNFPIVELDKEIVLHLKGAPHDRLSFEEGRILFDGNPPVVVHFNGTSERKLIEEVRVSRVKRGEQSRRDYLSRRVSHRISRLADSRAVQALVDIDVRGMPRWIARRVLPERARASFREAFRSFRR